MFKIIDINVKEAKNKLMPDSECFYIGVKFIPPEDYHFGKSGKYYRAVMVTDIPKYEQYWEDPSNLEYDNVADEGDASHIVFRTSSPRDIGLCKTVDVIGDDIFQPQEDGSYLYEDYISKNYITEACLKQLQEMKDHIDRGHCRWGNFPDQAGAFRSGDPFHDFLSVVETMHRFWD